jgi:hypothetical protein
VNAAVSEHAKLLGLIPGRRYLYLGLPLLQSLTVPQLRAVLAHELGHYSGAHTRLGAVAYRGRLAIGGTVARIGRWNVAGWPIRLYARLYLIIDSAVSRRQELEADAAAVRVAGRAAAVGALTEVEVVNSAYNFYLGRYVAPGAELGLLPHNVFAGFGELIAARADEIARLRANTEPSRETSVWDTHPPLGVRIAHINAQPEGALSADERRAVELLPDLDAIGRRLHELVIKVEGREVLPWDQFRAATSQRQAQATADSLFREIGRRLGNSKVGLAEVLAAIEGGRGGEIGEAFFPDSTRKEAAVKLAGPLELLLDLAAVKSGRASWRHSWAGATTLVDADGEPLDLSQVAALAANPLTLAQARDQLVALGIDVAVVEVVDQRATARGAEVIAGFANVKFDGTESDLVVLDNGLVVLPTRADSNQGKARLQALVGRMSPQELAKQYRFLPYEEFRVVSITKQIPLRAEIRLHDGQTHQLQESWSGEFLHKKSRDVLIEIFEQFKEE